MDAINFKSNDLNDSIKLYFGLPFVDAMVKAHVVSMQHGNIEGLHNGAQVEMLIGVYAYLDPDTALKKIKDIESNENILKNEICFLLKMILLRKEFFFCFSERCTSMDKIRLENLTKKYKLKGPHTSPGDPFNIAPIVACFLAEEFNIKKGDASLCFLPSEMKVYKNFKEHYNVDAIMALLPSGKKYGGFVKALLDLQQLHLSYSEEIVIMTGKTPFEIVLATNRTFYHSSIYPQEKRVQFFENLGIEENDLIQWSEFFNQKYPYLKNIHKFLGQTA